MIVSERQNALKSFRGDCSAKQLLFAFFNFTVQYMYIIPDKLGSGIATILAF